MEKTLNLKLVQRGKRNFPDEVLELNSTPSLIGREDADFVIKNDTYLSGTHFAAWYDEKSHQLVVRDVGSTNGTIVEGKKINPHTNYFIKEGTIFKAGECLFMVVS